MHITNDGPALVSTDYWQSEHAARELFYLSINAGTARLLGPGTTAWMLTELLGVDAPVELIRTREDGRDVYEIAWLDEPTQPYVLQIDARQSDRLIPCSEAGRVIPLVTYAPDPARGPEAAQIVRRESAIVRCRGVLGV